MATQGVVAQPLLITGVQQFDQVKHWSTGTHQHLQSGVSRTSSGRSVCSQKNKGKFTMAFVQHCRLAERLPKSVCPPQPGTTGSKGARHVESPLMSCLISR